jgi:hypothetical protein
VSLDKILQVVMRGRPDYLGVAAPLAVNLAREVLASQTGAIRIEQILTFGGPVTSDDRKTINAAFGSTGVSLSGTALVEIVDQQGRACTGRRAGARAGYIAAQLWNTTHSL